MCIFTKRGIIYKLMMKQQLLLDSLQKAKANVNK